MSKKSERNQEQQQGRAEKAHKGYLPSLTDPEAHRTGARKAEVENPVYHVHSVREHENPDGHREGR